MSPGEQKQKSETTTDEECKIIENEFMFLI